MQAIRFAASARALAGSVSKVATSFSISSLKRVAAPKPTIDKAPVTWCKCVATNFWTLASAGSANSLSRFARASFKECSISALTQESGPVSNEFCVLTDIKNYPGVRCVNKTKDAWVCIKALPWIHAKRSSCARKSLAMQVDKMHGEGGLKDCAVMIIR